MLFALFASVARIVGAGKDIVVAWKFGTGDDLDAFLLQATFVVFITTSISSAVASIGTPAFVNAITRGGRKEAQQLLSNMLLLTLCLATIYTTALAVESRAVLRALAGGFSTHKLEFTNDLLLSMLPALPLAAVASVLEAFLNAQERFSLAAAMPTVQYVIILLLVVVGASRYGVQTLVIGQIVGWLLTIAVLAAAVVRLDYSLRLRWYGLDTATRSSIRQAVPYMLGGAIAGLSPVIDQAMASHLAAGSVASLNYGYKVVGAFLGIASVVVSRATLPYFSRMIARHELKQLSIMLRRSSGVVLAISLPVTLAFLLLADPIIRIVFQHGAFTTQDRHGVAAIFMLYSLQIPLFNLRALALQVIYAANRSAFIGVACILSASANAGLDWAFMRRWGAPGIALSTSCVVGLDLLVYYLYIKWHFWRTRHDFSRSA